MRRRLNWAGKRIRPSFRLIRILFEEFMANTPQARKRIRRNEARTTVNRNRVSRIRTLIKKVELAMAGGDKTEATAAMAAMQPELARGVAKGVIHKNTAARKYSRLTKRLGTLT
jgi:small subunit ribosomal protein S20